MSLCRRRRAHSTGGPTSLAKHWLAASVSQARSPFPGTESSPAGCAGPSPPESPQPRARPFRGGAASRGPVPAPRPQRWRPRDTWSHCYINAVKYRQNVCNALCMNYFKKRQLYLLPLQVSNNVCSKKSGRTPCPRQNTLRLPSWAPRLPRAVCLPNQRTGAL